MKKNMYLLLALFLCTGTIIGQNIPSYLPADGLVGWWPFNGDANDESGLGNNGAVNGATLTDDRFGSSGKAYNFDGINDDILVPHNPLFNSNPITINLWMKSNGDADGGNLITKYCCSNWQGWTIQVSGADADTTTFTREYLRGGCKGIYQWYCGAEPQQRLTAFDEQWHMYTFRVDNSGATIFWDGAIVATQNWVGPAGPISNSLNMCIGSYFSNGYFYTGMLDDIAIWNRALTPQEINAVFNAPSTNSNNNSSTSIHVPSAISYQAVARNAQGQALANSSVQVKFTLLADSINGSSEYVELHSLTTNAMGLFTTAFGNGTPLSGTFANIHWASGNKYLKVEMDAGGGFISIGTQQMLSVPYSIRSQSSATIINNALPVYSDNADALAAGLQAGEMYRTATGDLKIVY